MKRAIQHYSFDADSTLLKVPDGINNQMFVEMSRLTGLPTNYIRDSIEFLNIGANGYSLQTHLNLLSSKFGNVDYFDRAYAGVTAFLRAQFSSILYPDTLDVLRELKRRGKSLSIITFGGEDYQKLKLECTGLYQEVDRVRIVTVGGQKPSNLAEILGELYVSPDQALYVDDRKNELRLMRDCFGESLRLNQIRRNPLSLGRSKETLSTEVQEFPVIRTLHELL